MSEMSTDQKIEQLVRSVLAAVDSRLDALRNEMRELADDTRQRDAALAQRLDEFERRLAQPALITRVPTPAPIPVAEVEPLSRTEAEVDLGDEIDIDRLTDLLSERLSRLSIPTSLH